MAPGNQPTGNSLTLTYWKSGTTDWKASSGPTPVILNTTGDEISKNLPDFVWLTSMDQTGPIVKLGGQSSGLRSVADFISALQRSGWFPLVDLVSSAEANNIITFNLQATFKSPEVAAKEAAAAARQPIPGSGPVKP